MKTRRFFVPEPLSGLRNVNLSGTPAAHIRRVLRLAAGDTVTLFDGSGAEYPGEIVSVSRASVGVRLLERRAVASEPKLQLILIQGVSQRARMDLTVQKATELGVSRIVPVITERSVARPSGDRAANRRQHWLSVAASACEQCGRNVLPVIDEPLQLDRVLADKPAADGHYLLAERGRTVAGTLQFTGKRLSYLVGPEGGFTDSELNAVAAAGFEAVRIGPRTLRTETAAIAFAAIAQARWGDMGERSDG